eukprot:Phypoly_transcript_24763.p1 GENE.Phypoly_transcript_24763~~Phypoly_transcript_24763.p1  ORF type:complete len:154 (+),score=29.94 Phypoly_transcript_24763:49-510(+)
MSVLSADNKNVPLAVRKEIKDNEGGKAGELAKLEKATGVSGWTYDFEGDLAAFNEAVDKDRKNRMGEILLGVYLPRIVAMIAKNCSDSMIKDAFVEAVTSKAIRFTPQAEKPKSTSDYQKCYVKNGTFYVSCHPENIWSNMGQIEDLKLENIL